MSGGLYVPAGHRVHLEPMVGETDGAFWLTVTISAGESYWTSPPASLRATDWQGALSEATGKVKALAGSLGLVREP